MAAKSTNEPNKHLQEALTKAGFSNLHLVADLGFVGWHPPSKNISGRGAPYRYKSLAKATADEIKRYIYSHSMPDALVDLDGLRQRLPIEFKTGIPKQVVAQKFPYGSIGVAALFHARSQCDLNTIDFYFGGSTLELLVAERKTRTEKPYHVTKVPGTNMIMLRSSHNFQQDYSIPAFQFERLLTGKRLEADHNVGFVEHVQIMKIGNYHVLIGAETNAADSDGYPAEITTFKSRGFGGRKVFFQLVSSGSLTLQKGINEKGVLTSVDVFELDDMAQSIANHHDVASLEHKLIRNMERFKEWDSQGYFNRGQVYRINFDPDLELHPTKSQNTLLPPDEVVKELLGTK